MHLRLRRWWRPAGRGFFPANRRQPAILGEGGIWRTTFMAMAVFAPSFSRFAKEKNPNQRADRHQGKDPVMMKKSAQAGDNLPMAGSASSMMLR